MDISVVMPAYNEAGNILNIINEITGVLNYLSKNSYEIIVVDDHSSDDTFTLVKNLSDPKIKCVRLSRNSGSHIALRAGLSQVRGRAALVISADGQDDPACLKEMIKEWQKGKKIVWAIRRSRNNESWFIRLSAKLFYRIMLWLVKAKDIQVDFSRADFCLLDRRVIDALNKCPEYNTSIFGLIAWLGFSQGTVEYERRLRKSGQSKWSLRNKFNLAKDWIVAFSGLPLTIVTFIGSLIAVCGLIYAFFLIYRALFIDPALGIRSIPAWASTVSFILILGGLQILILGILGEYLWRNLDESRRRPLYFIEADTENNKDNL